MGNKEEKNNSLNHKESCLDCSIFACPLVGSQKVACVHKRKKEDFFSATFITEEVDSDLAFS